MLVVVLIYPPKALVKGFIINRVQHGESLSLSIVNPEHPWTHKTSSWTVHALLIDGAVDCGHACVQCDVCFRRFQKVFDWPGSSKCMRNSFSHWNTVEEYWQEKKCSPFWCLRLMPE